MAFAPDHILGLLKELNDALTLETAEPVEWVICGGTALALHGLIRRTTRDVDVLGDRSSSGVEVAAVRRFPDPVVRAIQRVADAHPELQLKRSSWVNLGPRQLVDWGLPDGFETRLAFRRIGDRLALHLLARPDLVALKLFAAADDLGERQDTHIADLHKLEPTAQEIESSIRWIARLPDQQSRIRPELKRIVEELGHEDLASYIIL